MKKTLHLPKIALLQAAFFALQFSMAAQTEATLLKELAEENRKSVEALVLYPQDARLAILEAAKHPELIVKAQGIREKTAAAFRTLIEDFPKEEQAVFYDLARYPELLPNLVQLPPGDAFVMRKRLEAVPPEKREAAIKVVSENRATLLKINDLQLTAQGAFHGLLTNYPAPVKKAFGKLADLPEVLDILNEDLRFTVLVGDAYRENPAWVIQKMDSLGLAVARSQAEELENWKTAIENDPEAQHELATATEEYREEYGYDDQDYAYEEREIREIHHYYHYPYWFGYPWWEPYPRWYPYPYWWDWGGWIYGPRVVVVYLPSYHFMHWYFDRPWHHHHYSHLSARFVNHYQGHRHSGTIISKTVSDWRERNRDLISEDFIADKNRLPERMREYGKFEADRREYNIKNPKKTASPEVFLEKNTRKYPELQRSKEKTRTEIEMPKAKETRKPSDWAPSKEPARTKTEPARPPETRKPETPKPNTPPEKQRPPRTQPNEPKPAPKPQTETPRPGEAKDYHRQNWEKPKAKEPEARPRERPLPQPRPAKPVKKDKPRGGG